MKQSNNQHYNFLDSDKIQLGDGMCKDRLFCEIAVSGDHEDAETLHQMLFKVANEYELSNCISCHESFNLTNLPPFIELPMIKPR